MRAIWLWVMLAVLFLFGGSNFVRRFLRGFFRGVDLYVDLYVWLTVDGKTVAYKNPKGTNGSDDQSLDLGPLRDSVLRSV
jgi:hypothetical protein